MMNLKPMLIKLNMMAESALTRLSSNISDNIYELKKLIRLPDTETIQQIIRYNKDYMLYLTDKRVFSLDHNADTDCIIDGFNNTQTPIDITTCHGHICILYSNPMYIDIYILTASDHFERTYGITLTIWDHTHINYINNAIIVWGETSFEMFQFTPEITPAITRSHYATLPQSKLFTQCIPIDEHTIVTHTDDNVVCRWTGGSIHASCTEMPKPLSMIYVNSKVICSQLTDGKNVITVLDFTTLAITHVLYPKSTILPRLLALSNRKILAYSHDKGLEIEIFDIPNIKSIHHSIMPLRRTSEILNAVALYPKKSKDRINEAIFWTETGEILALAKKSTVSMTVY